MATLGRNIYFPIYKDVNGVPTSFENLVLKKSVVDSSLMSLSDNITGNVYYKDNSLQVSQHEYIVYENVRYVLVNPPTIVREGLASNNSENKGMTKYSFTFYHPMYQLQNLPFTDVAVQNTEIRYKSEDKKFSWIGNLQDFIAKINKNLENTTWVVKLSERVPQAVVDKLSDVLSFDCATIADALKQMYDTWEVPFIIDSIKEGEIYYDLGRRFQILVGLPSNEIYASEEDRQLENPFVFRFGKGVGLKNNSATPRNNKIITRIAGYGSENNIPYGYPQIIWTGNQDWDYTINNDPTEYHSYPIYDGIVGGQSVRLIKHPFTRTYLMPSIYVEKVNKKVNPNAEGYNPNIELVDYYDADDSSVYPNTIVANAPSYEIHQFEDIKPELGEQHIVDAWPINNDLTDAESWDDTMDGEGNYTQSYFKVKLPVLSFDIYACAGITEEMQINMRSGACIGCTFQVQVDWEDYKRNFYDSDGNFQPYGQQRDYEKYPRSDQGQIDLVLQKDNSTFGVLMPNVYQHPKGVTEIPSYDGDIFVVLGISLPLSYITLAQTRLDNAMKSYMLENNVHYFDYPLKFDEKFLYDNTNILEQIRNNTIIRFEFANAEFELYVKQISIKYGEGVLPQYDITLTDDVSVVLNQIGQAQEDISKINSLISSIQQTYNRNVWVEINKKLSKVNDDTAQGKITFLKGLTTSGDIKTSDFVVDSGGAAIYQDEQHNWHIEGDFLHARKKLTAKEVQIEEVSHIGGAQMLTAASAQCAFVVDKGDYWRCFFVRVGDDGKKITNKWKVGDQAYCNTFNLERQENNPDGTEGAYGNHYYWRLVTGCSNDSTGIYDDNTYTIDGVSYNAIDYHYIDLSKSICGVGSSEPKEGDDIVQFGYQGTDGADRQNAIVIAGAGNGSPYIRQYTGIDTFNIPSPDTQIKPNDNKFTGIVNIANGSTIDGKDLVTTINDLIDGQENWELDIEGLTTGNENLLRNTGFTGDYESGDVESQTEVDENTPMYSPELKYWEYDHATPVATIESATGMSVSIDRGYIQQSPTRGLIAGENYCIGFKASGDYIYVTCGGYFEAMELGESNVRKVIKFTCTDVNVPFRLEGTCQLMDVQLTQGIIPNSDWIPSPLDNDKAISKFQDLVYLSNAIANASTSILGGLILTQMIRVGNYRNGAMPINGETGGMSGLYTSKNSPFLWGGGTMEQAFYTIGKYMNNPAYQATDEEVANMAKFVVTHGGRAILNDIILRGYIYAVGGVFNGTVYANDGEFNGTVYANGGEFKNISSPNGKFNITEDGTLQCSDAKLNGYLYTPLFIINESNYTSYLIPTSLVGNYTVAWGGTGLNIQFEENQQVQSMVLHLPLTSDFLGANIKIFNNTLIDITIVVSDDPRYGSSTLVSGSLGMYMCVEHQRYEKYIWMKIN